MHADGVQQKLIAHTLGVSRSAVCLIVRGKRRKPCDPA